MKIPAIGAVVFAYLAVLAASSSLAQQASKGNPKGPKGAATAEGKRTFSSICASCHGLDGRGGERGPNIATRPDIARLTDVDTMKVLRDGIPEKGMPPFTDLGSAKLSAVLSYLRELQGKGAQTVLTGDPGKGKELFFGKAGCSACHMVNGSGGFLGPELSAFGANHGPDEIRAAIANPAPQSEGQFGTAELVTKDGRKYSGIVRNEDNFSIQLQSPDGAFHFYSKTDLASIHRQESLMPTDYGSRLTTTELDDLAAFLLRAAQTKP